MIAQQQRLAVMVAFVLLAVLAALGLRDGDDAGGAADDEQVVLWTLDLSTVRAVAVDGPEASWVLSRKGERWVVSDAARTLPADPVAAHDVLDAIREAARGVRVEGGELADFGLDAPVRMRVETVGGARTLEVGRETPVGRRTYLRDPRTPGVLAVQGGLGVVARQQVSTLWDVHAPGFDDAEVVAVVGPDDTVWRRARRAQGAWTWDVNGQGDATAWVHGWSELPLALDAPVRGAVVATVRGGGEIIGVVRGDGAWGLALPDGRAGAVGVELGPWLGMPEGHGSPAGP